MAGSRRNWTGTGIFLVLLLGAGAWATSAARDWMKDRELRDADPCRYETPSVLMSRYPVLTQAWDRKTMLLQIFSAEQDKQSAPIEYAAKQDPKAAQQYATFAVAQIKALAAYAQSLEEAWQAECRLAVANSTN